MTIVFDIDDTLYLERDYVRSGFNAVGRWLQDSRGVAGFGAAAWELFESGVRGDTFDRALVAVGLEKTPELIRELVSRYRNHEPEIAMLDDAAWAVNVYRAVGPIAFITDGPVASQRAKARALGLYDLSVHVILTGELGEGFGKPHPRAFELVAARTEASPSACVYIADNPLKDFRAPRMLGWKTIRARRPGGLHVETPSDDDVDHEVTDLGELRTILGE